MEPSRDDRWKLLSPKEREIAEKYSRGNYSYRQLARELGLPVAKVVFAVRLAGIPGRTAWTVPASRWPDLTARNREFEELHKQGVPIRHIAKKFGLSPQTVRLWLARAGIRAPRGRPPKLRLVVESVAQATDLATAISKVVFWKNARGVQSWCETTADGARSLVERLLRDGVTHDRIKVASWPTEITYVQGG